MIRGRPAILAGMAGGLVWAVALLWLGARLDTIQGIPLPRSLAMALFPTGCLMAAMVARLAQRRFFSDATIDGAPFPADGLDAVDQRVLANTTEQLVLAAALWPLAGFVLGSGVVLALGTGLAISRLLFWIGYRTAPPLRAFGFAAGFYPTILAALWTMIALI